MDSKYLKAAVVLAVVSFLFITALFVLVLILSHNLSSPELPTQPATCPQEQAIVLTEQFIRNTATYAFDGIEGSIQKLRAESGDGGKTWQLTYMFKCQHPGYGDRSDQMLVEAVTEHSALVTIQDCTIVSAICDKTYDLLNDRQIK